MAQTIHSFQRSVRLPSANLEAALPQRQELEARVQQAAASLVAQDPALECATATDEDGGHVVRLNTPAYEIVITSRCGQDRVIRPGEKLSFVSYTLVANSHLKSFDKAASVAEELTVILRIAGAILFAILLFWGMSVVLNTYGHVVIPHLFVLVAFVIGGWLGERLGCLLGNWLQERSLARASQRGILPQFEAIWFSLEHHLQTLLKTYEST
jgi:hypothetical protein